LNRNLTQTAFWFERLDKAALFLIPLGGFWIYFCLTQNETSLLSFFFGTEKKKKKKTWDGKAPLGRGLGGVMDNPGMSWSSTTGLFGWGLGLYA
jgi:hypothetical protein